MKTIFGRNIMDFSKFCGIAFDRSDLRIISELIIIDLFLYNYTEYAFQCFLIFLSSLTFLRILFARKTIVVFITIGTC